MTTPAQTWSSSAPRVEPVSFLRPVDPTLPQHALTVDVEDWYQSCIDYDAPITERVVRNVDRLLALLDECSVKATFFVQGKVAETFPKLVGSLVAEGHEVQSHGYSHRPLSSMNAAELRDEIERGKGTVEDAAARAVTAFRAPDFSISRSTLWAFEILADAGFAIDSSIFPMRSRHYGIANWPLEPHNLVLTDGRHILEVPVAIWPLGRFRLPVAGGGYLRMLPTSLVARGLRAISASGRPAVVYCHPYEMSEDEVDGYKEVSARFRFQQRIGRRSFPKDLSGLLSSLPFGPLSDVIAAWGIG